jgi:hypothetical protein
MNTNFDMLWRIHMLLHIGLIEDPALHERVRRWLTNTYGCSVTRCLSSTEEAQSLLITGNDIQTIITDIPPGKLLQNRYDEISCFTHGRIHIIIIVSQDAGRICVPKGERAFTIIMANHLETDLNKTLRFR